VSRTVVLGSVEVPRHRNGDAALDINRWLASHQSKYGLDGSTGYPETVYDVPPDHP
jgi:hypothetical protein